MARKAKMVIVKDELIWLDIRLAASLLGTTRRKMIDRALAGEFRFEEDRFGVPIRVAEPDVAPLRAAKIARAHGRAKPTPRPKTPEQQEAAWAKMAAENVIYRPVGRLTSAHALRLTLPHPKKDEPK